MKENLNVAKSFFIYLLILYMRKCMFLLHTTVRLCTWAVYAMLHGQFKGFSKVLLYIIFTFSAGISI